MATKVIIQVEKCKEEKNFSCYMVDKFPDFHLVGFGNSAKQKYESPACIPFDSNQEFAAYVFC